MVMEHKADYCSMEALILVIGNMVSHSRHCTCIMHHELDLIKLCFVYHLKSCYPKVEMFDNFVWPLL